ncbi:MAG: hypothetical protein IIA66_14405 [Planctomycetes bacterium]|nr:hypothetical protein [Planctomycetota bacterium]
MASAGPGRLTTRKVGKYEYWCCFWRNSSNDQRSHPFGNVKKVTRREAEHKYRLWLPTWVPDPVPDDWRTKTVTVDELVDRYIAWVEVEYPDKPCPDPSEKGTHRRQIIDAVKYLRPYGKFRAADFRPRMLREIRDDGH